MNVKSALGIEFGACDYECSDEEFEDIVVYWLELFREHGDDIPAYVNTPPPGSDSSMAHEQAALLYQEEVEKA